MAAVAAPCTKRPTRTDSESTLILPAFRQPQKAQLRRDLPKGDDWLFEVKYDGYRSQAAIAGDRVRLYSSSGLDWTGKQFAWLAPHFRAVGHGPLLIDGEVCALDERGRPDFSRLKLSLDGKHPLVFYAFDLLVADGEDLTRLPLADRKARLEAVLQRLPAGSPIQYSWHATDGAALFQAMHDSELEGLVAKRAGSVYVPGDRSDSWLKIKTTQRQEFVVIGWRPPEYGPDDVRGLFLATYEDGELVYRGGVGTGFTDRMRRQTLQVLQLIRRDERLQVKGMPRPEARVCHWVEPRLLAEVEFTEITPDGVVRHPSFKGLREDKAPADVHLEEAI
ncbi:MAG: non-homologous end-joining DNA ligase [Devosia sp.]